MGEHLASLRHTEEEPTPGLEYSVLHDRETRENLKSRMEEFIDHIHAQRVDVLVFLDRSARPLSWMLREMWKMKYPQEPLPQVKFVNIGKPSHTHAGTRSNIDLLLLSHHDHDRLLLRIEEMLKEDRWLEPSDIPYGKDGIKPVPKEQVRQLQNIFQERLDEKHVLLVDDIVASGKNIVEALASFHQAFPNALVQAAGFYPSTMRSDLLWSIEHEKELLPWFREDGLSAVLELEDVEETLLSSSLSPENVRAHLARLEEKRDEYLKSVLESTQLFAELLKRLETLLKEKPETFETTQRGAVEDGITQMHSMSTDFLKTQNSRAFDLGRLQDIWIAVFRPFLQMTPLSDDLRDLLERIRDASPSAAGLRDLKTLDTAIEAYRDPKRLRDRARHLRDELAQLAREEG